MYVCIYVRNMYTCNDVFMYIMYVRMYAYMYICVCVCILDICIVPFMNPTKALEHDGSLRDRTVQTELYSTVWSDKHQENQMQLPTQPNQNSRNRRSGKQTNTHYKQQTMKQTHRTTDTNSLIINKSQETGSSRTAKRKQMKKTPKNRNRKTGQATGHRANPIHIVLQYKKAFPIGHRHRQQS